MVAAGAFVARMTWELVPGASAQEEGLDCDDFASQADAQEELRRALTDPNGLDPDADGEACDEYPYPQDETTTRQDETTTRSIPAETTRPLPAAAAGHGRGAAGGGGAAGLRVGRAGGRPRPSYARRRLPARVPDREGRRLPPLSDDRRLRPRGGGDLPRGDDAARTGTVPRIGPGSSSGLRPLGGVAGRIAGTSWPGQTPRPP